MTARYPYLHVHVSHDHSELVSSELFELGAQGIEERDASTLVKGDPDAPDVTLVASFESESDADAARAVLAPRFVARIAFVEGDAWRDGWKAYWKPTRIGRRLVVTPSWETYAPGADDLVLTLDPGSAFGTGSHETTRLVLEQLERVVRAGQDVLDVGTGSGILAIACALFGASRVRALDTDPDAVRACEENAALNGVAGCVRAELASSSGGSLVDGTRYPLVLANIETRVLVPMARELVATVAPLGTLVLSGILRPELEQIRTTYLTLGLREVSFAELGEWAAIVLERAP